MQHHADQILALLQSFEPLDTLESREVPVEAVLAIGPEWALAPDNANDPNCGCIDSPEWDSTLDAQYTTHGPSTIEHRGHLYVLAGDWKYPIYFRFDRKE